MLIGIPHAYTTIGKNDVFLKLTAPKSLPWGKTITFTATLTDMSDGEKPIEGALIRFSGSGVIGNKLQAENTTDSAGRAVWTGTAPSSVANNWMVQAHYAGSALYYPENSEIRTYSTLKHNIDLSVSSFDFSVPWGGQVSFASLLRDTTNGYTPIAEATIEWNGTGVMGNKVTVENTTDSAGRAVWTGTAPSSVANNWMVQAHYAGSALYYPENSEIRTYSTLRHATSLFLKVNPNWMTSSSNGTYALTGTLIDTDTNKTVVGKTISIMSQESNRTIDDATTQRQGNYAVQGLAAPKTPGSHIIAAIFAEDPLYNASSSAEILTVFNRSAVIDIQDIDDINEPSYIISKNAKNGSKVDAFNTASNSVEFTDDDAADAINFAINASSGTNQNTIKIESGEYFFKSKIRPISNTQIIGDGINHTILIPQEVGQKLILNQNPIDPSSQLGSVDRNIVLGNFTVDYKGSAGDDVINLVNVKGAHIFQVVIQNVSSRTDALDLDGSESVIVESVKFFNIGGSAIHISDAYKEWTTNKGSSDITVIDAFASNVGKEREVAAFNAYARKTAISGADNISLSNIYVEQSYGGIELPDFSSHNKVINATIVESIPRAMRIGGQNHLIKNIIMDDSSQSGVLKAENATIQNALILDSRGSSIYTNNSTDVYISNIGISDNSDVKTPEIILENTTYSVIRDIFIPYPQALQTASYFNLKIREGGTSNFNDITILPNPYQTNLSVAKVGKDTIISNNNRSSSDK